LLAICAQRLVRRLCDCSEKTDFTKEQAEIMKRFAPEMKDAYAPKGCNFCDESGFVSRFGCFELLINDFTMQQAILHTLSASKLRDIARKSGMQTLFEDALFKVRAGLTSLDEVLRVVVPE
ncbi:MAG: type II/IV secretion system protein, partial [Planctomycetota bacterium]|nr:type II/IV secretion system protein [Planctomycetota bacterium]